MFWIMRPAMIIIHEFNIPKVWNFNSNFVVITSRFLHIDLLLLSFFFSFWNFIKFLRRLHSWKFGAELIFEQKRCSTHLKQVAAGNRTDGFSVWVTAFFDRFFYLNLSRDTRSSDWPLDSKTQNHKIPSTVGGQHVVALQKLLFQGCFWNTLHPTRCMNIELYITLRVFLISIVLFRLV